MVESAEGGLKTPKTFYSSRTTLALRHALHEQTTQNTPNRLHRRYTLDDGEKSSSRSFETSAQMQQYSSNSDHIRCLSTRRLLFGMVEPDTAEDCRHLSIVSPDSLAMQCVAGDHIRSRPPSLRRLHPRMHPEHSIGQETSAVSRDFQDEKISTRIFATGLCLGFMEWLMASSEQVLVQSHGDSETVHEQ